MSIGVALATADTTNYVDAVVAQAKQVAADGLKSVWFGQRFDYDAAALATVVGREVPELSVGTSAIPIFGRHPLLVSSRPRPRRPPRTGGSGSGWRWARKTCWKAVSASPTSVRWPGCASS